jgi:hypothetical protein
VSFVWLPLTAFHIQVCPWEVGKPYQVSCDGEEVRSFVSFTVELYHVRLLVKVIEKAI